MSSIVFVLAIALVSTFTSALDAVTNPQWVVDQGLTLYDYALFSDVAYRPGNLRNSPKFGNRITPSAKRLPAQPSKYRLQSVSENKHTEFVTLYNEDRQHLVLAFRGTESMGDAIDDLKALNSPWPFAGRGSDALKGVKVHDGFKEQYAEARADVLDAVSSHIGDGRQVKITTTGHSLGAALSTVAALDIFHEFGVVVDIVNFGSPRGGNSGFKAAVRSIGGNIARVANVCTECLDSPPGRVSEVLCQDKVSVLPPEGEEYMHVSDEAIRVPMKSGATIHMGASFELKLHGLGTYEENLYDQLSVKDEL